MSKSPQCLPAQLNQQQLKCTTSRSRISSNTKPVRLSTYHGQRSQSKTKQFISQMVQQNSKNTNSSTSSSVLKDLHRSLDGLIGELIQKLEEKRKILLESWNQSELKSAEKLIMGLKDTLLKDEPPMLTINCIPTPKYNNQSFSCSFSGLETTRSRGGTFSTMRNPFKVFDLDTPRGDSKIFEVKTPSNQETLPSQQLQVKTTFGPLPLTPESKPRPPLLRIPTKTSDNFLKPPCQVTFSPKQRHG